MADKEGLKAIQKTYLEELKASPFHQGLTAAGTGGATSFLLSIGDCPSDNWASTGTDSLPTAGNLDAATMDVYKLKALRLSHLPHPLRRPHRDHRGPLCHRR